MENPENKEFYEFGAFRLNVKERLLWREDEPVALTLKEFEVLLFLVENAGEVIGKNELLDAVWKDVFIEEGTMTRSISRLRKKLEAENGETENIIETMPKRGYRFLPEVIKSNKNALVIKEKTLTHIRVEETLEVDNAELMRRGEGEMGREGDRENTNLLLPNNALSPRRPFSSSPFLPIFLAAVALAGIGFIIYQNYFETHAPKPVVASHIAPFSGSVGREETPAFSPDGKQLAYSWNGGEGNSNDIYVKLVGAGEPLRLTKTDANERYPTFSPDGSHIAFVRGQMAEPSEVVIVPSLGGAERRVARLFSGYYSISYAPDGQSIAVIDTENSVVGGQFAVYLLDIETGERRRVTAPAEFTGETTPRFSPDGKSLAFIRITTDEKQDLFIVPTAGGEPRQITFDGSIINSLTWSADGQNIYFVSLRVGNQPNIWRAAAAGGEPQTFSTGGRNITNIAASPDGKTLAFVENINQTSIWRFTKDGQPATRLINSTVNELAPQFSPDGSRIVFLSDRTGRYEIWTADADGKNLRQLTDTPVALDSPQFSPDGSRIAFNRRDDEGFANFIISAEGGAARRITPEGMQDNFPAWSADGKWIYFISNRTGELNIWKMPVDDGGEAVQITRSRAVLAKPAPDGKTVFFVKSNFAAELWRIPADGGAEEIVPEFTAAGFLGSWTMTKAGIYFLVNEPDNNIKIKFYDFAAGQITDAPGNYKIPPNNYDSPATTDGNVFLSSVQDQASRLMLAELP